MSWPLHMHTCCGSCRGGRRTFPRDSTARCCRHDTGTWTRRYLQALPESRPLHSSRRCERSLGYSETIYCRPLAAAPNYNNKLSSISWIAYSVNIRTCTMIRYMLSLKLVTLYSGSAQNMTLILLPKISSRVLNVLLNVVEGGPKILRE